MSIRLLYSSGVTHHEQSVISKNIMSCVSLSPNRWAKSTPLLSSGVCSPLEQQPCETSIPQIVGRLTGHVLRESRMFRPDLEGGKNGSPSFCNIQGSCQDIASYKTVTRGPKDLALS